MFLALLKERDIVKTINNLCMLSFSSIFDNIKVLMRSLTAAKRNYKSKTKKMFRIELYKCEINCVKGVGTR